MPSIDQSACEAGLGKSCPTGEWCCLDEKTNKSVCTPCQNKLSSWHGWGGYCLELANTTCSAHNYKAWNDFADLQEYIYNTGSAIIKKELEEYACSKIPTLPFCTTP
jgi:hypothetical protein